MRFLRKRGGSLLALAVGVAILVLYVALQPGPRPEAVESAPTTSTTEAPTTTVDPGTELCSLAREFEEGSKGQDAPAVARQAEIFYARASQLAIDSVRPEFEALADYYTEFNNIGEQYEYDLLAILGSPDGDRWQQLVFREPLGFPTAKSNVAFLCEVNLPPPPTITTTTTTRPRTTLPPESTSPDGTPATSAPATSAPPASTPG